MPINLEEIITGGQGNNTIATALQAINQAPVSAKFFNKELTGTGMHDKGYFHRNNGTVAQLRDNKVYLPKVYNGGQSVPVGIMNITNAFLRDIQIEHMHALFEGIRNTEIPADNEPHLSKIHMPNPFNDYIKQAAIIAPTIAYSEESLLNHFPYIEDAMAEQSNYAATIAKYVNAGKAVPKKYSKKPKTLWESIDNNPQSDYQVYTALDVQVLPVFTTRTETANDPADANSQTTVTTSNKFGFGANAGIFLSKDASRSGLYKKRPIIELRSIDPSLTDIKEAIERFEAEEVNLYVSTPVVGRNYLQSYMAVIAQHSQLSQAEQYAIETQVQDVIDNYLVAKALMYHAQALHDNGFNMVKEALDLYKTYTVDDDHLYKAVHATIGMLNDWKYDEDMVSTLNFNYLYAFIQNNITDIIRQNNIANINLRLLLAKRMFSLNELFENNQLHALPPTDPQIDAYLQAASTYSLQQKAIITTKDPLTVVTAGAGTGKSYTLVGRLKYLQQNKVDLKNVMVLSFTNTAAENITTRFPEIKSLTLANLFNQIYTMKFPNHQLSHHATVANAVILLNPHAPMFAAFTPSDVMTAMQKFYTILNLFDNTANSFKKIDIQSATKSLTAFITQNFDITIAMLNAVGQTTLDIQQIVLYHMLTNDLTALTIPTEYQGIKYIITDESQDISTFEYILLLALTEYYKSQLMLFGDSSQTLYEFRNANAKFMNAIEASGLFTPYRLTVNYRSRQAILTYANQWLQVIDANRYAGIQLTSDQLTQINDNDIRDAVHIENINFNDTKKKDRADYLTHWFDNNAHFEKWVIEKYKAKEQIAVMSFLNKEVEIMIEEVTRILEKHGYKDEFVRLAPGRTKPKCHLTHALKQIQSELVNVPIDKNYAHNVRQLFEKAHFASFKDKSKAYFPYYAAKILDRIFTSAIFIAQFNEVYTGKSSRDILDKYLINEVIQQEINENSIMSILNRQNHKQVDVKTTQLIASSIHTAKGLEFDNCIIMFDETRTGAMKQDSFRLYGGVALTRAKKSQFILNISKMDYLDQSEMERQPTDIVRMFKEPMVTAYARAIDQTKGNIVQPQPTQTAPQAPTTGATNGQAVNAAPLTDTDTNDTTTTPVDSLPPTDVDTNVDDTQAPTA